MKNRDMPAEANNIDLQTIECMGLKTSRVDDIGKFNAGLTKLEYAAIHILAGNLARNGNTSVSESINKANALFYELEQENSNE